MKYAAGLVLVMGLTASVAEPGLVAPSTGNIISEFGCQLDYEYYPVQRDPAPGTVILAHGFMRNLNAMRGWAEHWQSAGIATVITSFCNANLLNGHHQRNASDMIALREHLQLGGVTYAGFSAGGLAAYLAAQQDSNAWAYLGLDSVDSGKLARNESAALSIPALFLVAAPSACNARNNMAYTIEQHDYKMSYIKGATHCHFEMPYDKRCAWLCGGTDEPETSAIQRDIVDQATKFIVEAGSSGTGMPASN